METSTADRAALDRARRSRDPRFDGRFFVGVTSTGIYCRPICPAPSARDAHVRYFATAAAAADAGFRPCLRCRPEAAPGTPAWLGTSAVVRRALALVHEGALDEGSVDALAARLGIGPRQLHRLFVAHVGASPLAVAQTRRLHFAKRLIDETDLPMTQIAFASGFASLRRFNDAFLRTYQRPPSALRRLRDAEAPPARGEVTLRLAFRPPSGFEDAVRFLAARAIPGVERVDAHGYARTVALPSGPATVAVGAVRGRNELRLRVGGAPATALLPLTTRVRRVFDLASDPATIGAALRGDPLLGPLVCRRPGLRIPGAWDAFECAVRAVVGQQVSVRAGRTLVTRLVERAGTRLARPMDGLARLFPSPEAIAAADLAGLGLVPARARTLAGLARAVADGKLVLEGPADEVRAALRELPGVGDWTAEYVALRALGEPDAFPAADLVLRRLAGDGPALTPRALAERAEAWRPWRGYAAVHLWEAAASRDCRAPVLAPRRRRLKMRYDEIDSPVGPLLVAGDEAGLRLIHFQAARRREPEASWRRDPAAFRGLAAQLGEYFRGERRAFDLPLAPRGTPFQLATWRALSAIPYGGTISYEELARRVGRPAASRAVGAANGANPLPIVVPCHRVIGKDGSLTGFGGGLDAKRALLELEGASGVAPRGQRRRAGLQAGQSQPKTPAARTA